MNSIIVKTKVRIWGTKNSWSLAPHPEYKKEGQMCEVTLEIQGNKQNGYHLVMSPSGFFTADSWYETKGEALDDAKKLFNINHQDWIANS